MAEVVSTEVNNLTKSGQPEEKIITQEKVSGEEKLVEVKSDNNSEEKASSPWTLVTEADIVKVQTTWNLVKPDVKAHGIEFLIRLFKEKPEYQAFFKSFANVPLADLPENKRMAGHALSVMYAISAVVDNLDDVEAAKAQLVKIGYNHYKRKVTVEMFTFLGGVLVGLMNDKLGSEVMNKETQESWGKVYACMIQGLAQGLSEAETENSLTTKLSTS